LVTIKKEMMQLAIGQDDAKEKMLVLVLVKI